MAIRDKAAAFLSQLNPAMQTVGAVLQAGVPVFFKKAQMYLLMQVMRLLGKAE